MADPISIAAIVGLVVAARKCSEQVEEKPVENFTSEEQPKENVYNDIKESR